MNEQEILQPEENLESVEATEAVDAGEAAEEQAVQDATEEPGAHIEETQTFQQAEAVEGALVEAMDAAEPPPEDDIPPAESGPEPKDLPPGSGILEEPHETVAMAEQPEAPGPADIAEVPEGVEFKLAGEDDGVGRDDHPMVEDPELSETSDKEEEDTPPAESGPEPKDLPPGSGILEEPHETVEMAEKPQAPGPADTAEVPEGIEFKLAGEDDDDKDEATPINLPGPVAEDDDDMQLISGPSRDDLPDGTGILEEPHKTVEVAGGLEDPGLAEAAEVPEGIEFKLAGEDDQAGAIGRDDHPMVEDPELSEASAGGVPAGELPLPSSDPKDLPEGSGTIDEGYDGGSKTYSPNPGVPDEGGWLGTGDDAGPVVEFEGDLGKPGIPGTVEVPEGLEFKLAGEDGTIDRDDHPMVEDPDLSEASGKDDDDKDEATPINLPGPVAAEEALSSLPIPIPEPARDHPGDPPPPPDLRGQTELSPDDVKLGENLQPAPDFEAMNPSEQSVVEIISKAISDEEFRTTLFADARSAIADFTVTDQDQTALGEMTVESFDFFATEVEKRLGEAVSKISGSALAEAQQKVMQQVVHAVWRDLNPGGLAYVLAYKIPQKHLQETCLC